MGKNIKITKEQFKKYCKFLLEQECKNCFVTQEQYDYIVNTEISNIEKNKKA